MVRRYPISMSAIIHIHSLNGALQCHVICFHFFAGKETKTYDKKNIYYSPSSLSVSSAVGSASAPHVLTTHIKIIAAKPS